MFKKFQLFVIIICVFGLRLPTVRRSPKIRYFARHKKSKHLLPSKKSHLQAFQTLGQETKKFFKRRIPNNFTITRIKFGLEGIVYPLLLCLDQNSDGLLTIFFYFWASVWEEKCTSISVRFTQNAEAKFLACVGFTSSS